MYHIQAIQNSPLQVYVSALLFSPERSLIRYHFKEEEPKNIVIQPPIGDQWGACLQTLKGHSSCVNSVAFSHDSTRLASASSDNAVKIWDASSGNCLQTLNIGKPLGRISFDITDSRLDTEIGTIKISALLGPPPLLTILEPRSPQYHGLALSANNVWITHNSKNLVWLPLEYRPSCSAISTNTIAIGDDSGRVWTCKASLVS
jgi:WD40 repeat protein